MTDIIKKMVETDQTDVNIIKFTDNTCKSIQVEKLLDLQLDLGTLLAIDTNDLNNKEIQSTKDQYLKTLARDNTQILLNSIWELPTEKIENNIVAKLPKSKFILPREKPAPKPKPLTKWQTYAKEKGIKTTKKSRVTWDDVLNKWVPRYGYKKAKAEKEKDWIIEVPGNVDPYTDMFEKKSSIKQEKVAKNEFQRLRNIAKAKKTKVPSMGLPPTPKMTAKQLNTAAQVANVSTASLGKFQPRLSKEKNLNKSSVLTVKKRKFPAPTKDEEYNRNLKLADSLLNKKPKLNLEKAVNREIYDQETSASERKKGGNNKQRKGRSNQNLKSSREFKKRTTGRKRR
ncbi:ribosome biogenesis regulatory protein homolog [Halyomorpha halys]|uniref:ribosome biogenesis regulatory protein homolog n=1 Tax=Halyomorpha halys TaxID=286706 RepID=UPI0006D4D3C7|nr:ribosome biogenesis regulatory protein homolog [Halyomorpha halys]